MFRFQLLSNALLASVFCIGQVQAAPSPCASHASVVKMLEGKYKENLAGFGLAGQAALVEVYVSANGSFTVLATNAKGHSCILATGQSWEKMEPPQKLTGL